MIFSASLVLVTRIEASTVEKNVKIFETINIVSKRVIHKVQYQGARIEVKKPIF